jgi:hemoglobin-like flavoprotein
MTPEQISLLEQSMTAPGFVLDAIVADFYRRLFAAHPGLTEMFGSDQAEQEAKFGAELAAILSGVRNPDAFSRRLHALGERHRSYGVVAEHYPVAGQILLETLAAHLGSDWTPEVADAWALAYGTIAEVMLAAAEQSSADA